MGEGQRRAPPSDAIVAPSGGWVRPWQKGQSGNPSGVQGEYYRVRKLCADDSLAVARELIDLAHNSKDDRVRYMAGMAVLERGIGKVRDHSQDSESVMDLTKLSEGERRTLLQLMSRVLGVEMPK